jgi:hypothetical protein
MTLKSVSALMMAISPRSGGAVSDCFGDGLVSRGVDFGRRRLREALGVMGSEAGAIMIPRGGADIGFSKVLPVPHVLKGKRCLIPLGQLTALRLGVVLSSERAPNFLLAAHFGDQVGGGVDADVIGTVTSSKLLRAGNFST